MEDILISNTSERLKEIMKERGLRQVDILEKAKPFCKKYNVKMNRSDISQYVSGISKPGQDKLAMLGMALDLNEAWLMGYETYKERTLEARVISDDEQKLTDNYEKLNEAGKKKLLDYSNDLIENPKYLPLQSLAQELVDAAHDDNLTDEEKQNAEEILRNALAKIRK